MDTVECPRCGNDNAFLRIVDKRGVHYECPDCDNEWCDTSFQIEEEEDD